MYSFSTRIGHAHIKVRDLDRAIDFYTRKLKLRLVERIGDQFAFLTSGDMHHEIALQCVGKNAPQPSGHGTGLYHIAFEVPDKHALALAYKELVEIGIKVTTVDHRISWALYFEDPDGNGLELYCDTRHEPGGVTLWSGQNAALPATKLLSVLTTGS